jgi:hypothetical protein
MVLAPVSVSYSDLCRCPTRILSPFPLLYPLSFPPLPRSSSYLLPALLPPLPLSSISAPILNPATICYPLHPRPPPSPRASPAPRTAAFSVSACFHVSLAIPAPPPPPSPCPPLSARPPLIPRDAPASSADRPIPPPQLPHRLALSPPIPPVSLAFPADRFGAGWRGVRRVFRRRAGGAVTCAG